MLFTLDTKQVDRLNIWIDEQNDHLRSQGRDPDHVGASGGRFTYSFTQTSIGQVIHVKDHLSGEQVDLTDYSQW